MRIAILTIGDELLNGDLTDTNTFAICQILSSHALLPAETATVGDLEKDIILALQRLARDCDAVIVTGGLGPTEDDRTAKAAAKAFNRSLSLNEKALQQIRDRFKLMRREMHPANEKQAMLPAKSTVIANSNGTAPGFFLEHDNTDLFFLPGVPNEMLAMFNHLVVPALLDNAPERPHLCRRDITVFGLPEPEVEARLKNSLPEEVNLAFNVSLPTVTIKLSARGDKSQKLVDRAELAVRKVLGEHVIGLDEETLAEVTAHLLVSSGLTVSLAESCTGGLIAKLLTDQAGASAFFERSIVSYANSAKADCLNVSEGLLEKHGAVSSECAAAMARGVRANSRTDIALAVTGIAGPEGGTETKPVGTVYIAIAGPDIDRTRRFHFPGNRDQVRLRTAYTAIDWLRRYAIRTLSTGQET